MLNYFNVILVEIIYKIYIYISHNYVLSCTHLGRNYTNTKCLFANLVIPCSVCIKS